MCLFRKQKVSIWKKKALAKNEKRQVVGTHYGASGYQAGIYDAPLNTDFYINEPCIFPAVCSVFLI